MESTLLVGLNFGQAMLLFIQTFIVMMAIFSLASRMRWGKAIGWLNPIPNVFAIIPTFVAGFAYYIATKWIITLSDFSLLAAFITMAFAVASGVVAYHEKTFSREQGRVNLSFCWHWGISIGDLLILAIVNGLIFPSFHFNLWWLVLVPFSATLTTVCYKDWWPKPDNIPAQGFILISSEEHSLAGDSWTKAVTKAGWIHFVFMTIELMILAEYIFTSIPALVVKIVTGLLLIFIPVAVIEPGVIQSGGDKKKIREAVIGAIALMILALLVAVFKLY